MKILYTYWIKFSIVYEILFDRPNRIAVKRCTSYQRFHFPVSNGRRILQPRITVSSVS